MAPPASPDLLKGLRSRLDSLGRDLGEREASYGEALAEARRHAGLLRGFVAVGLEAFHRAAEDAGAAQLRIELSEPRTDDKHVRAVEFDLRRGRHHAIVTVKSRGAVTLVGPFRAGNAEGPCRTLPLDAEDEIHEALTRFLEKFLEEACAP